MICEIREICACLPAGRGKKVTMNEEAHWNKIANRYEDEIFDVFRSDKNKKLPAYFQKHSGRSHFAIDFGCGVGKAFAYLSPLFEKVLGTDISGECLAIAKTRPYSNISFKRADLTRRGLRFPVADFAFCCNVVMLPEIEKNAEMLRNIQRALRINGAAVFVLPSLESILYSSARMMEWYRKEGVAIEKIPNSEFSYYKGSKSDIVRGIMNINGVPTKHYLESEIQVFFADAKLAVTSIDRVEYEWNTEFSEPPGWMKAPYPWDWLVECRKTK